MLDRINIKYALAWFTWLTCSPAHTHVHAHSMKCVHCAHICMLQLFFFRFFNALPQQSAQLSPLPPLIFAFSLPSFFLLSPISLPSLCPSPCLCLSLNLSQLATWRRNVLNFYSWICYASLFLCVLLCVCVWVHMCVRVCWVNLNLIEKHVTQRQQTASTARTPPSSAL